MATDSEAKVGADVAGGKSGLRSLRPVTVIPAAVTLFVIYVFVKQYCVTGWRFPITAAALAYLIAYLAGTLPGRFFGTGTIQNVRVKASSGLGIFFFFAAFMIFAPTDRVAASCANELSLSQYEQKLQSMSQSAEQLQAENDALKRDVALERLMGQLSTMMVDFRDLQRYEVAVKSATIKDKSYDILIGGLEGLRTNIYRENEDIQNAIDEILPPQNSPAPANTGGNGNPQMSNKAAIGAGAYTTIAYVRAKSCMIGALSQNIDHGEPFLSSADRHASCSINAADAAIHYIDRVIRDNMDTQDPKVQQDQKYLKDLKQREEFQRQIALEHYKDNLHFVRGVSYIVQYRVQQDRKTNEIDLADLMTKIKTEFNRDYIDLDYLRVQLRPRMHNIITWFCEYGSNGQDFATPCGLD
jgi:hypothetical protein